MMMDELIILAQDIGNVVNQIPVKDRARPVEMGADGTPTAHIDKVAEKIILDYVEGEKLPLNILSEEAGFIDRGFDDTLVVDPIDGTSNAKRNIPYFSVSLAIGRQNIQDISLGIVYNPCTGDLYHAEKGEGAYFNGVKLDSTQTNAELDNLMISTHFGGDTNTGIYDIIKNFKKVRAFGSASLDICSVASGQSSVYYYNNDDPTQRLRVTDIAASVLILREAGGQIYDTSGKPLSMSLDLDDRNNMIALMDDSILEVFL